MPAAKKSAIKLADNNGQSRSEAVYQALSQGLREGLYRPGDRLREEEVAQRLNVSRTPVREAFGRLAAKGFVQPAGARGLVVRNLTMSEILELYAMREILEGAAARLAAQHASHPEIDGLRDIEAKYEADFDDTVSMARVNRQFHEAVFRAARNRYLDAALQEMHDGIALLGQTTFSVKGRPVKAAAEHRAIIDAIEARDPEKAEELARAHIRAALRARLKLLQ
jgi:DNA-binding GntR family transcriptional regulator